MSQYMLLRLSGNYAGVWFDDARNTWVFDVAKCIDKLEDAMVEARKHKQDAIYDMATGREIRLTPVEVINK